MYDWEGYGESVLVAFFSDFTPTPNPAWRAFSRSSFVVVTGEQALFSFRFENYIPADTAKRILAVAVDRENVWEPLKLGLISGYMLLWLTFYFLYSFLVCVENFKGLNMN